MKILAVMMIPLDNIQRSPENDTLYRPVDKDDPEIQALALSIRQNGVLEPLVVTQDNFLLSGHRRLVVSRIAGLKEVPCRVEPILHDDPRFVSLLREYNRQRDKSNDERLREEVISANPEKAYAELVKHREAKRDSAFPVGNSLAITGVKRRSEISEAKRPFLSRALLVLRRLRKFHPLSVRQIHYQLLNEPPLIHANKPDSTYRNDLSSYKALSDLLTRGRLTGDVPMEAISDETRPVMVCSGYTNVSPYIRQEINGFLKNYYRSLQQSQPNHIEIVAEKNTLKGILLPVAMDYTIPLTIGRGYSSLPPRYEIVRRFLASGKERLVLLILSDFDPDGEEIAHSLARSLRDDFGVDTLKAIKVCLTFEQIQQWRLPPTLEAKRSSSNFAKFEQQYGRNVFELEAVAPETLQESLRHAIESVMDMEAYRWEVEAEKEDAINLERYRQRAYMSLSDVVNSDGFEKEE